MGVGIFTVSIDLEIAWGACGKPLTAAQRAGFARERTIVRRLLEFFERYEVAASWGVVGHLMQKADPWCNDVPHADLPRPIIRGASHDWFCQLGRSTDDPLWYGRDLVKWIRAARPAQEIGSHSYFHLPFDEAATSRCAIEADIRKARETHARLGLPYEMFIFPYNVVGFRDLLKAAGIRVYRGRSPRWYDGLRFKPLRRALNLLQFLWPGTPRTVQPQIDELGLVNVPDSLLLLGRNGLRRIIPPGHLVRLACSGIDAAIERGEIFHLWFHPSNFYHRIDEQFTLFEQILAHAHQQQRVGRLQVKTMGHIADDVLAARRYRAAA